jgi:hypothetical protein
LFYPVVEPKPTPGRKQEAALVVLNSAQSQRLVAKAAVACPIVQNAYKDGMIIIARGVTNAFVTEEFFDITIENKANQTVGYIGQGITNVTSTPPPALQHVIEKGKIVENADSNKEILKFKKDDVVIKGANAIDHKGLVGTFACSVKCGTMGSAWPICTPRGGHFIVPVSLEKMIPCVMTAAQHTGIYHFKYATGVPAKIVPLVEAKAITEIEAFAILCDVKAYHVGSGGIAGSEGSVHLSLEGDDDKIEKAMELVKSFKDEPPIQMPDAYKIQDPNEYNYDAQKQLDVLEGI